MTVCDPQQYKIGSVINFIVDFCTSSHSSSLLTSQMLAK